MKPSELKEALGDLSKVRRIAFEFTGANGMEIENPHFDAGSITPALLRIYSDDHTYLINPDLVAGVKMIART
jgi:hypothetical protein